MIRLISFLIYILSNQAYVESMDFFWKVYDQTKSCSHSFRGRIAGCLMHRIFKREGANIPVETTFNDRPTFPHGLQGIWISQKASIGSGCTIFHQVTIGSNMLKDSKGYGAPTIGNNVYIGTGAKIIGNVTIGDNCRIGANCVITTDIPSDSTVVLSHPRIIASKGERNNAFTSIKNQ